MHREEATELILEAKKENDLTFEAIANKVGRHKVWTTAALMGQHPMGEDRRGPARARRRGIEGAAGDPDARQPRL